MFVVSLLEENIVNNFEDIVNNIDVELLTFILRVQKVIHRYVMSSRFINVMFTRIGFVI